MTDKHISHAEVFKVYCVAQHSVHRLTVAGNFWRMDNQVQVGHIS